ncbi:zinc finger, RING/FYVE/PHD-type [Artemisia annua]|uniref:RING-type E3 ubiquitin transferase n=1 Tax=Artemisia annua TaxID=35608 RepID=A0A2U1L1Z4_ARTAN|nr:zinc finger, RING/FYVE/PHD-type [Artemisia annua]
MSGTKRSSKVGSMKTATLNPFHALNSVKSDDNLRSNEGISTKVDAEVTKPSNDSINSNTVNKVWKSVDGMDEDNVTSSQLPRVPNVVSIYYHCLRRTHSTPPPSISFGTTIYDEADNHHLIRFSRGLDDDVLVTFPTLLYSDVKGDTTANDANGSECSICLADYKPADVVRLLPDCRHLFHVKCIDTWLKAHPTCPMCRKTPLANTVTV